MNRLLLQALAVTLALCGCGGDDTRTIVEQTPAPTTTDPTVFNFRTDMVDAFNKVDRMGGPATTTALLVPGSSGGARRQQANSTEPAQDAQYAQEYITSLRVYHYELAPVLAQLGIAPCATVPAGATSSTTPTPTDVNKCVAQALAMANIIPDVVKLDTSRPSSYPNGRRPDDQVVDILLAIALVNLTDASARCMGGPCTLRTLADLPLNVRISSPPSLGNDYPYLNNVQLAPPPPANP